MILNRMNSEILKRTIAKLRDEPTHYPHLHVDSVESAVAVSKSHMACKALAGRGGVYSFSVAKRTPDEAVFVKGIVFHGEYGHFVATFDGTKPVQSCCRIDRSPHFTFSEEKVPNVNSMSEELMRLMLRAVGVGFETTSICQWFDSVYRLHTNRRTSPNFDPRQVAEKLQVMIEPGIRYLETKKGLWAEIPELQPQG